MFKVGQRVWSIQRGHGKVFAQDSEWKVGYPVEVVHDKGDSEYYTEEGKYFAHDLRPSLFLDEPKDWPNPPAQPEPLPDLAVDTPVWVRFWGDDRWHPRHFAKWHIGKMWVFISGKTPHSSSATSQVDEWLIKKPE